MKLSELVTKYNSLDFNNDFNTKTTDELDEGINNKYNRQGDFNQSNTASPDYIKNKFRRINISSSRNLANEDNNSVLIINGTVTLTFSGVYIENFSFNFKVKLNSSLIIANGDKTLLDTTEAAQTQIVAEASTFGTVYQFDINTFIAEGI